MMEIQAAITACSICGEPLNTKGECLVCLLRGGLNGLLEESVPERDSLVFGEFEIARREDGSLWELGSGAMGVTYRATDRVLHRTVALKVIEIPAGAGNAQAVRERFLREARAAATLKHPNVAGIFQFGAAPEVNRCYYAMELVEGETLEALVRRDGPLKVDMALEIAIQVTRALIGAAAQGLIHRDLKPGNIMIARLDSGGGEMEVKVIDFGLAKATNAMAETDLTHGGFIGTPTFASPEQFAGAPADARSDIYSLGITLWYALTGEVPYPGKIIGEVCERQKNNPLPIQRLTQRRIPTAVSEILRYMLAIDPMKRPASAQQLLKQLEAYRQQGQRRRKVLITAAAITLVLTLFGILVLRRENPATTTNEKSIAVLPFENLSDEKEHAFFADGVQDDILIKLAKIADLKVISRTSVAQYRGKQDVRQIGNALGVSNVLEGTVRRSGSKVHVNAQLVDTRTDQDIWADEYDRDLNDVFAIETEVAQSISNRLRAKVSAREKAAIKEWPTKDLVAYDFYVRAIPLLDWISNSSNPEKDLSTAVNLLNQAITRDPSFFLAYCRLAEAHDGVYFHTSVDHTPSRLALAKSAIDSAFRLKPDSGEAHLALALHFYWGYTDYGHARAELALARHALPNNPNLFHMTALIDRRQGRWTEAVRNFERATELDPRNVLLLTHLGGACWLSRAYDKADNSFARVIAINPGDSGARLSRAFIAVASRADTRAFRAAIEKIRADDPAFAETDGMKGAMLWLAMSERDLAAASRIAEKLPENAPTDQAGLGRSFIKGLVARMKGDDAGARSAFTIARAEQEKAIRARPDIAELVSGLALIDAGLGRKEEALREGRRAVDLMPLAKDSLDGAIVLTYFAQICAWTGERDFAIQQLEMAAKIPAGPHYGGLRLDPMWDSLRGDPRFEKIVASLKPKAGEK